MLAVRTANLMAKRHRQEVWRDVQASQDSPAGPKAPDYSFDPLALAFHWLGARDTPRFVLTREDAQQTLLRAALSTMQEVRQEESGRAASAPSTEPDGAHSALAERVASALENIAPDGADRHEQFTFQAYDELIEKSTATSDASSSAEVEAGGAFVNVDGWPTAVWWLALLVALLGPVVAVVGVIAAEDGAAQGLSVLISFVSVLVAALAMTFSALKPVVVVRASVSAAWRKDDPDAKSRDGVGQLPSARLALDDDVENHLAAALGLEPYEVNATAVSLASDGTVSKEFADKCNDAEAVDIQLEIAAFDEDMVRARIEELEQDKQAELLRDHVKVTDPKIKKLNAALGRLNDRLDVMTDVNMPDAADTSELRTQFAALVLRWQLNYNHSLIRKGSARYAMHDENPRRTFVSHATGDCKATKAWLALCAILVVLLLAGDLVLLFGGILAHDCSAQSNMVSACSSAIADVSLSVGAAKLECEATGFCTFSTECSMQKTQQDCEDVYPAGSCIFHDGSCADANEDRLVSDFGLSDRTHSSVYRATPQCLAHPICRFRSLIITLCSCFAVLSLSLAVACVMVLHVSMREQLLETPLVSDPKGLWLVVTQAALNPVRKYSLPEHLNQPVGIESEAVAEPEPEPEPETETEAETAPTLESELTRELSSRSSLFESMVQKMEDMQKEIAVLKEQVKIQEKVKREIIHTRSFELFVLHAIILSTIVAGVQSYDVQHVLLDVLEYWILIVFVTELGVQAFAYGAEYLRDRWRVFDLIVVVACILSMTVHSDDESASWVMVLRTLRLLRIVKLVQAIDGLKTIVAGLGEGMDTMIYIVLLLGMFYYVFGIIAVLLFRENDPINFDTLHIAMLSLFRVSTLEDWTDIMYINIYGCDQTYFGYPAVRGMEVPNGTYGLHIQYPCKAATVFDDNLATIASTQRKDGDTLEFRLDPYLQQDSHYRLGLIFRAQTDEQCSEACAGGFAISVGGEEILDEYSPWKKQCSSCSSTSIFEPAGSVLDGLGTFVTYDFATQSDTTSLLVLSKATETPFLCGYMLEQDPADFRAGKTSDGFFTGSGVDESSDTDFGFAGARVFAGAVDVGGSSGDLRVNEVLFSADDVAGDTSETEVKFGTEPQGAVSAIYFVIFVFVTGLVMLSLFIGVVTEGMESSTDELAKKLLKQRIEKNKKRIQMLKMSKQEIKLAKVKKQIMEIEEAAVAASNRGLKASDENPEKLIELKEERDRYELELSEYRKESKVVRDLKAKIEKIEQRDEDYVSPEDKASLASLRYKLKRELKATGTGSVRCRTCVRCLRVWWWDETDEWRERHRHRTRRKMLDSLAQSAEQTHTNDEDDEPPKPGLDTSPLRWKIRESIVEGADKFVNHDAVTAVVILSIVVAALLAGIEVGLDKSEEIPTWMRVVEWIVLSIFTLELVIKMVAEGNQPWNYFRFQMNVFDFAVVCICWVTVLAGTSSADADEASSFIAALRSLRLLRVLRLFDQISELRVIIEGMQKGMEAIMFIALLISLVFYVFAIFALYVFGENDPFHFPNLHTAVISLFRAATGEDWTDIMYISIYGCDSWGYSDPQANAAALTFASRKLSAPDWVDCADAASGSGWAATIYWIVFFLLVAFVGLNLFVAVVTTAMAVAQDEKKWRDFDSRLMRLIRKEYSAKAFGEMRDLNDLGNRLGEAEQRRWVLTERKIEDIYRPVFSRLDLDEDGVVSWDELLDRLKEVRDADPDGHAVRVEETCGQFMSTKWLEEFKEMVDRNADGVLSLAEITDMFHGARAREVEREIQLQPELVDLGVGDLRERAKRERVANSAIERAAASDEPEMQLIRLICAAAEVEPLQHASFGSKKSSREIVKEKIRQEFYDKNWKALWEVLSYEVLDSVDSEQLRAENMFEESEDQEWYDSKRQALKGSLESGLAPRP